MPEDRAERPIDRELREPTQGCFATYPAIRLVVSLVRTADQFEHGFARLLRDHGLTVSKYGVLRILRDVGRDLTVVELTGFMVHETPAMTGLLDRLQSDGFVDRKRSAEDRRLVYVSILPKAEALVGKLDEPVALLHEDFVAGLTKAERDELERLLLKVRAATSARCG